MPAMDDIIGKTSTNMFLCFVTGLHTHTICSLSNSKQQAEET